MSKYIKKNPLLKEDDKIKGIYRNHIKYCSLQEFIKSLPNIRKDVSQLLEKFNYSKDSIIAVILGIIDSCSFRIGKDEYFKKNKSIGISTLQKENVEFLIDKIILSFLGKKQVFNSCVIYKHEIINIITNLYQHHNGKFMFNYEEDDKLKKITYIDVNKFLNKYGKFTTKYYRTLKANVLFIYYLKGTNLPTTKREATKNYKEALEFTSKKLYHTPQICKKNYLDSNLIMLYQENTKEFYKLLKEYNRSDISNIQLSCEEKIYLSFISNYCWNLIK
jgi:DNA topoisomerase I